MVILSHLTVARVSWLHLHVLLYDRQTATVDIVDKHSGQRTHNLDLDWSRATPVNHIYEPIRGRGARNEPSIYICSPVTRAWQQLLNSVCWLYVHF